MNIRSGPWFITSCLGALAYVILGSMVTPFFKTYASHLVNPDPQAVEAWVFAASFSVQCVSGGLLAWLVGEGYALLLPRTEVFTAMEGGLGGCASALAAHLLGGLGGLFLSLLIVTKDLGPDLRHGEGIQLALFQIALTVMVVLAGGMLSLLFGWLGGALGIKWFSDIESLEAE